MRVIIHDSDGNQQILNAQREPKRPQRSDGPRAKDHLRNRVEARRYRALGNNCNQAGISRHRYRVPTPALRRSRRGQRCGCMPRPTADSRRSVPADQIHGQCPVRIRRGFPTIRAHRCRHRWRNPSRCPCATSRPPISTAWSCIRRSRAPGRRSRRGAPWSRSLPAAGSANSASATATSSGRWLRFTKRRA